MSYKALYRKYRPKKFDDVLGQNHIISTLRNIIYNKKIGHAYLFSGPRGTGKTSVAHIFAKEVNKNENGEEIIGEMDIIEIDAASNNGVAEIRTIINNVNYAPTKSKYKVYIIDEVHMLTKGAFNALLKTLEDPPVHTIFILATTEPHKIPITILSRVQRFNFKRIEDHVITHQLSNILNKENIIFDEESIKYISKLAQGGLRDSLSIADQASAFGNGIISFDIISKVFGIISIDNQIKLINLAYKNSSNELMKLSTQFLDNGSDIERLSSSLLEVIKDFIIFKKTKNSDLMSFLNKKEVEQLSIDIDYAYNVVDILFKLISELRFTSIPRQLFELSILKMINKSNKQINKEEKNKNNLHKEEDYKPLKLKEIKEKNIKDININPNHQLDFKIFPKNKINKIKKIEIQETPINNNNSINKLNKEKTTEETTYNVEQIINLLVQSDKLIIEKMKEKFLSINNYMNDLHFNNFAELLNETKIITSGKNFILLGSEKKYIVDGINLEKNNIKFIEFINKIIGKPTHLFIITKEQFILVKNKWKILSLNKKLPDPIPIETLQLKSKEKTKEEIYGESLFSDLFSS